MPTRARAATRVSIVTILVGVLPAAASVDLTGTWRLGDGVPLRLTQSGTQLTAVVPGRPPQATGTIDPDTGVFAIDLAALYNEFAGAGFPGLCTFALDATAAPDGNSFAGTASASEFCVPPPFICNPGQCLPAVSVAVSGERSSCPDGILDPGEVCDDGTVTGCCSFYPAPCQAFLPAGSTCADDGDPLTDDVCDAAGTCTHPHVLCPNGVLDPGEQCDDGNTSFTDCCYLCQFRPSGVPCADDGDPFTRDVCDGAGTCEHLRCGNHFLDPGEVCDYAAPGACCAADCQSTLPRATPCDADASPGTPDVCDASGHCVQSISCGLQPVFGCRADLGGSRLLVRTAGAKSRLAFRWKGIAGETTAADVGDPVASTSLQLCLYVGGSPVATAMVPRADVCDGKPCWTTLPTGFRYADRAGAIRGIRKARVSVRSDESLLAIDGDGPTLPLPAALPPDGAVTAQLFLFEPGAVRCWEAVYTAPRVRTATEIRASR